MIILRQKAFSEIEQREFNSKAQKLRKEAWEVLKGQKLLDKDTNGFRKSAIKGLKSNPETSLEFKEAKKLLKDTELDKKISRKIKRNPNVDTKLLNKSLERGKPNMIEDTKVFDKKIARSGAESVNQFVNEMGGSRKRLEYTLNRSRGVKKVRGAK